MRMSDPEKPGCGGMHVRLATRTMKKQKPSIRKTDRSARPVVLIMAGGKGERFWPRSTRSSPKQLQKIYSNKTLLQETIDRARKLTTADRIFIGCNAALKKAIQRGHNVADANFIVEPEGRNTAPIVALAALHLEDRFPGAVHLVLSADHFIHPVDRFAESMQKAMGLARDGLLVTCGVVPSRPDSGYGYIQPDTKAKLPGGWRIARFHEKPDLSRAQDYVRQGFLWNSGIFIWTGASILAEFEHHAPDILGPLRDAYRRPAVLRRVFGTIPDRPIDVAIMEKSDRSAVVSASFQWDDVGSWLALERIYANRADDQGNIVIGEGIPTVTEGASGNIIVPGSKRLIALLGVKDMVCVETDNVLLIASKSGLDGIKRLMGQIKGKAALQRFLQ